MGTSELSKYRADLHTHSTFSDGLSKPQQIVDVAIQKELSIIGLTDHDTIQGWTEFWKAAEQRAASTAVLLAILGVEISTREGHVIVLFPDRNQAENFSRSYTPATSKNAADRPGVLDVVSRNIADFNAICIFAHPEFNQINGIGMKNILEIINSLSPDLRKNIGIEVYNWMTQVFFWRYQQNSQKAVAESSLNDFAQFSLTDSHHAYHVGNGVTTMLMESLDAASFVTAVHTRKTIPERRGSGRGRDLATAVIFGGLVHAINKLTRK